MRQDHDIHFAPDKTASNEKGRAVSAAFCFGTPVSCFCRERHIFSPAAFYGILSRCRAGRRRASRRRRIGHADGLTGPRVGDVAEIDARLGHHVDHRGQLKKADLAEDQIGIADQKGRRNRRYDRARRSPLICLAPLPRLQRGRIDVQFGNHGLVRLYRPLGGGTYGAMIAPAAAKKLARSVSATGNDCDVKSDSVRQVLIQSKPEQVLVGRLGGRSAARLAR